VTELVKKFNELVEEAQTKGLTQFKPVKRFADSATGEKRIKALQEALAGGPVAGEPPAAAEPATETKPAAKEKRKKPTAKSGNVKGNKTATEVEEILGARSSGTKKAKLLAYMIDNKNKPIPMTRLVIQVYGNGSKESVGSFGNCIGGLIKTLAKTKYRIERDKDKEVTFALVTKT
jgi:hypothetical protein